MSSVRELTGHVSAVLDRTIVERIGYSSEHLRVLTAVCHTDGRREFPTFVYTSVHRVFHFSFHSHAKHLRMLGRSDGGLDSDVLSKDGRA